MRLVISNVAFAGVASSPWIGVLRADWSTRPAAQRIYKTVSVYELLHPRLERSVCNGALADCMPHMEDKLKTPVSQSSVLFQPRDGPR